uniref:Acetylserotonin O-methyltransferase-like n=1 Tax=Paramormyrops kingsleyae TaxID=1676925 RepID=A0A3B3RK13_9TELE
MINYYGAPKSKVCTFKSEDSHKLTMVLNPVISKLSGKLVVLASASPRRLEILTNVGMRFEVVPSWFKENLDKALFKKPYEYAVETAKQKALEVAKRMPFKHLKTPDIVIGADTIVTVGGLILEKPVDKQDAYRILSRLNGKEHSVYTGVAIILCHEKEDQEIEYKVVDFYEETKVKFADLSEEMLWEYIHSGEPMDKAGGYGIQALGGMLVEHVQGDFLNVVGFPLNHFCKELDKIFNSPSSDTADRRCTLAAEGMAGEIPEDHSSAVRKRNVAQCGSRDRFEFPHRIADLLDGFKASKALFTACKLKVFDLLASAEYLSATQVAGNISGSLMGTERLLDAVVSLGLLEKLKLGDTIAYRNTEQTSRYLVSTSELALNEYILYCDERVWPLFTHLEQSVLEGVSQHDHAFGKRCEEPSKHACCNHREKQLQFMKAMHSMAKVAGSHVATAFDLSSFRTACDLGGCTGAMAFAFSKVHPALSVIVFDLPAVVEMCAHFHPRGQDLSRVTFVAGDFFSDDLPKADLYILARILHHLPAEKVHALLSKLSEICKPGCGVLLSEIFLDEGTRGQSSGILQALTMTQGVQRSAAEYSLLLQKYGFTQVSIKHTGNFLDAILGVKP